jgi:hypothetical protein
MILSNVTTGVVTALHRASHDAGIRSPVPCTRRVPHLGESDVFGVFRV